MASWLASEHFVIYYQYSVLMVSTKEQALKIWFQDEMKETVVTGFTPRVQVAASERGRSNFTLFVFSGQHGRSFVNTAHGHVWWLEWLVGNCNCDADGANYQLLVATRPRRYQPLVLEELKRDFSVAGWMVVHDSSHICALNLVAFLVHVLVQLCNSFMIRYDFFSAM